MMNDQARQLRYEFVRLFSKTFNERVDNPRHIRMLALVFVWFPYIFTCILVPLHALAVISTPVMFYGVLALVVFGAYQYVKIAVVDTVETITATDIVLNAHPAIALALARTRKAQWADVDAGYAW